MYTIYICIYTQYTHIQIYKQILLNIYTVTHSAKHLPRWCAAWEPQR